MAAHAEATLKAREPLTRGLEDAIEALRALDPRRRLGEIATFAALWAVGIGLGLWGPLLGAPWEWPARIAGVAFSAVALNAFYLLSHEGHHGLLFRRPWANHAANIALCLPLLHSPTAYRVLHERHHRYLGGPGDPDEFTNYTRDPRLIWLLHWVRLLIGTLVYMPLIPVVAWRRAVAADRRGIALEYAGMGVVWVMVFLLFPMDALLQVWLVPGVLVGYFSAVRAVSQHGLTDREDPLTASRSVRSNRLVSFLLINENYHLEHHLFPEVPSYNLPRLRALLAPRLTRVTEAESYTRFITAFVARALRGDASPMDRREREPGGSP